MSKMSAAVAALALCACASSPAPAAPPPAAPVSVTRAWGSGGVEMRLWGAPVRVEVGYDGRGGADCVRWSVLVWMLRAAGDYPPGCLALK